MRKYFEFFEIIVFSMVLKRATPFRMFDFEFIFRNLNTLSHIQI
jgi:hypothetical protein